MDKNWLIGKENKLPWRYKEDLQYFKEKTHNKTVLMGENTFLSLRDVYYKNRSLPFSKIYVATRNEKTIYENVMMINDIASFLKNIEEDIWVIGGATTYEIALPYADELYITWILEEYEGDCYFKKFPLEEDFKLITNKEGKTPELNFSVYRRQNK